MARRWGWRFGSCGSTMEAWWVRDYMCPKPQAKKAAKLPPLQGERNCVWHVTRTSGSTTRTLWISGTKEVHNPVAVSIMAQWIEKYNVARWEQHGRPYNLAVATPRTARYRGAGSSAYPRTRRWTSSSWPAIWRRGRCFPWCLVALPTCPANTTAHGCTHGARRSNSKFNPSPLPPHVPPP